MGEVARALGREIAARLCHRKGHAQPSLWGLWAATLGKPGKTKTQVGRGIGTHA